MKSRLVPAACLLALLGGLAAIWLAARRNPPAGAPAAPPDTEARAAAAAEAFLQLEARERQAAAQHWPAELDAERHEDRIVALWDLLNQSADPWEVLAGAVPAGLHLPALASAVAHEAGITVQRSDPGRPRRTCSADECRAWLAIQAATWKLAHTRWQLFEHHPATNAHAAWSRVRVTASLERIEPAGRTRLVATLKVNWVPGEGLSPQAGLVEVEDLEISRRDGPPPFSVWLDEVVAAPRHTPFTDPLIAADLDGDGFSELLLVGAGRRWRNLPDAAVPGGRRLAGSLWSSPPPHRIVATLLADVDGDNVSELLAAGGRDLSVQPLDGLGNPTGTPRAAWTATTAMPHPQVLTGGDVDGDGDLDLWLAQYRLPYQGGQFPTPWFDARDGFPGHLLRNDGKGGFTDVTEAAGLAPLRLRRSYSASLLDLDGDGDLDLVNVSDFAGLDVFLNDGSGRFADATDALRLARHSFGMSHAFNDANGDNLPDLLMLGMDSPVASRMMTLGLARGTTDPPEGSLATRAAMVAGNRLYLGAPTAGLVAADEAREAPLRGTGWSWGCAWADFNLDGTPDLAVANGHETFASTQDYERQFWKHDLYVAGSRRNPVAELYFRNAGGQRRAAQASYGGWQENALLLSHPDGGWLDAAWLLGAALPQDGRNQVADDLDGDGDLDLAVTTFEQWPVLRQRLIVFRNDLPRSDRNWLGVRLATPAFGTRVEVRTAERSFFRWHVAGDSFRSQGAPAFHFGLGKTRPLEVRLTWPGGRMTTISNPPVNRWLKVSPPGQAGH